MKRIRIDNIKFGYSKKSILFHNFSVDFLDEKGTGYIYALMGPSGCGKTTLIKLILDLEKPYQGIISSNPSLPVISYIPQEPILFDHLTPEQNAAFFKNLKNYSNRFDDETFDSMSSLLGLKAILNNVKNIRDLSGGERQRLSILRALSIRPDILFFDEPLTGLDAENKNEILIAIRELSIRFKLLVIYITHHFTEAQIISDEIAYMTKNANGIVENIFIKKTSDFINFPPVLEAAVSLNFPSFNVIKCVIDKGFILHEETSSSLEKYYIFFGDNCVSFNRENGYKFHLIVNSNQYSIIKLDGFSNLVKSSLKPNNDDLFILLNGSAMIFDMNKKLKYVVRIVDNKIIWSNDNKD
jgi:ABC-type multidrug transport system ATPase subunit